MDTLSETKKIREKYEKTLMRKKGVVGCAVGYKHINGKKTDQPCIICYVIKKIQEDQLSEEELIPPMIEGIPTDIVESGGMSAL
jgi:hypothetical protein